MTTCTIATDAALFALCDEWDDLWRRTPDASPFQSPAWLLPWWRQFGTGLPRVTILREHGTLAGVLPLYVFDEAHARKLLPIGAGITDYQDALIGPNAPPGATRMLLDFALGHAARDDVTVCDLIDVPPDALLRSAPPIVEWRETDPCPVLSLSPGVDGLRASIPSATHRKLRMNRNRAELVGGAAVQVATAETLPDLLEALFRLHESRWSGHGVLADPQVQAFHREAAPLLLAAGALRLGVLSLCGTAAAACYALLAGPRRILFYLSGYDASFARQSPGTLLLGAMLEDAVREGREEAHFLRGGERYKYAWGGRDRMNAACRLVPP
jgi:CelD/BcsL family acetyltransferase involved in cellulose biosynthesis